MFFFQVSRERGSNNVLRLSEVHVTYAGLHKDNWSVILFYAFSSPYIISLTHLNSCVLAIYILYTFYRVYLFNSVSITFCVFTVIKNFGCP